MINCETVHALPFNLQVSICRPFECMRLCIRAQSKEAEADIELLDDLLSYFVSAANAGMFSGQPYRPESAFARSAPESDSQLGKIGYVWEFRDVQPAAVKVLIGMVVQSHFGHVPLRKFEVSTVSRSVDCLNVEGVASGGYPTRVSGIPFPVTCPEDLESLTMPALRLEFSRALESKEFLFVEQRVADWHTLALLGGYSDSFVPMKGFPFRPSNTYLTAPNIVEHVLYGFSGPVAVYDSFVNMAVKLHACLCPMSRLEIE